ESSNSTGSKVGINVDYGILILLKVNGEIVIDIEVENNNIRISGGNSNLNNYTPKTFSTNGGYSSNSKKEYNLVGDGTKKSILFKKDKCLFDFTDSNFDGKCYNNPKKIIDITILKKENIDENPNDLSVEKKEENSEEENNFNISFSIPINNKGNTHIKTTGEINLFDEDGNQINQIGKKIIVNEKGAIIGEEIVNYLPINDNEGNILPGTKRIFKPEWKGFPYKEYSQELGKEIIKYKNPGEFYSEKSDKGDFRLMFWERIGYEKDTKKITAKFDISYDNEKGEEISFPSAQEFNITYTRKYIGYNYYFIFGIIILIILAILFLIIFFWIIGLITKKKKKLKKIKNIKNIKKKLKK
ncbi:MAG: hypothetical protein Q9M94_05240, partial [Candidatus Gracilibacteria bacterium]|nr:hypothetical protein [Candidatus Gracilibacteria bacterium]